jgi:hypothetical protein
LISTIRNGPYDDHSPRIMGIGSRRCSLVPPFPVVIVNLYGRTKLAVIDLSLSIESTRGLSFSCP